MAVKTRKIRFNGVQTPAAYNQNGYVGALVVAVLAFTLLWLINGLSTAWGNRIPITVIARGIGNLLGEPLVLSAGVVWGLGWVGHIGMSLVERHLLRARNRLFYILWIPLQWWDMFTATLGIMIFFTGSFVDHGFWSSVLYTVLGFLLSICEIPLVISIDYLIAAVKGEQYA